MATINITVSLDTVIKNDKKKTINGDQQINISVEESTSNESISSISEDSSNSLSIEDIRPMNDSLPDICSSEIEYISIDQQFVELTSLEDDQESAMSDSSSDTVDYDFDTEICASRTFESQECMIPLSTCHDNEC
ncbi:unnamed protein product [Rotaria magnacalcarata]|uniref:Uncharacterized protein n=1 Tax=Rotaria magnacalcarata TaxID=392030 RepID=A0A8S3IQ21_9BILA|nr:unnamed protein product [Rotaria magnacalcarata]